MAKWLYEHSLSLVLISLFLVFLVGQSLTGFSQYNEDATEHQQPEIGFSQYLTTGHFIEATFENWESEFLQMAAYVLLTVKLVQKGSAESKKLRGKEPVDQAVTRSDKPTMPWPVRKGGVWLYIYKHSLSLALIALFALSFSLHAYGGSRETCQDNLAHGETTCQSTLGYMTTSKFWFESFQNWQSEFLAVFSLVVLSVYLREVGSPESKPVMTPHYQTGNE